MYIGYPYSDDILIYSEQMLHRRLSPYEFLTKVDGSSDFSLFKGAESFEGAICLMPFTIVPSSSFLSSDPLLSCDFSSKTFLCLANLDRSSFCLCLAWSSFFFLSSSVAFSASP